MALAPHCNYLLDRVDKKALKGGRYGPWGFVASERSSANLGGISFGGRILRKNSRKGEKWGRTRNEEARLHEEPGFFQRQNLNCERKHEHHNKLPLTASQLGYRLVSVSTYSRGLVIPLSWS